MKDKNLVLIVAVILMFAVAIYLDIKNGVFPLQSGKKAKQEKITPKKLIQRPSLDEVPVYQKTVLPIDKSNSKRPRLPKEAIAPIAIHSTMYVNEDGRKYSYDELQRRYRKQENIWLKKQRYEEYIKQCILEEFGEENIHSPRTAQVIAQINRKGDVEYYQVSSVIYASKPRVYSQKNDIDDVLYKKKLEKAFLKAAPFQPFPDGIREESMNLGLNVGNGQVHIVRRHGDISRYSKKYNSFGKRRNSKKVEDIKITEAYVLGRGYETEGHYSLQRNLLHNKNLINWTPVTTADNEVILRCTLKNGKIVEPMFVKKSDLKEANEAALDAMYSTKLPDLGKLNDFPIIKLEYKFSVK